MLEDLFEEQLPVSFLVSSFLYIHGLEKVRTYFLEAAFLGDPCNLRDGGVRTIDLELEVEVASAVQALKS